MKQSLLWRFTIIVLSIVAAALCVRYLPLRKGLDLNGGTELVYELDTSKIDSNQDLTQLAERVIDVLKKRVDPAGQKNIVWRVVSGKRIQIQMPQPDQKVIDLRKELDQAWNDLEKVSLKQSAVMNAIHKPAGAERDAAIEKVAVDQDLRKLIVSLAVANDHLEDARKKIDQVGPDKASEAIFEAQYDAQKAYDEAFAKLNDQNIDTQWLRNLLQRIHDPKNSVLKNELKGLAEKYPLQKVQIQRVIDLDNQVQELSGGSVDDPDELNRLLTSSGVLDFRIAVTSGELPQNSAEYQAAKDSLAKDPDRQVKVGGVNAKWFEIEPSATDNFRGGSDVIEPRTVNGATISYLLCYDDSQHTILHPEKDPIKHPWSVTAHEPEVDPQSNGGGLELPFEMDASGANYMSNLTSAYKGQPMAILLDDMAITAPRINSEISKSGVITFGTASADRPLESIKKEANQLKQIMDAGSLPGKLQQQPISKVQISSSMGADNIQRGIDSAYYAVIAVVAFMLIYYTITGFFADLALMVNLLMILATMAFFGGTFTLPGIAGLVLTLGMAVDANVLINERIREEIHKGASLWMAIKQGYDKVFWTIFDANLTCSLTAIVLYYFGSEEVKGFGVTLLIGLIIHMYTALFVTRTLMMASVRSLAFKAVVGIALVVSGGLLLWAARFLWMAQFSPEVKIPILGTPDVKMVIAAVLLGLLFLGIGAAFIGSMKRGQLLQAVDDHSIGEYLKEIFTFTWLRNGHWPFMRVITVSNIDWIGKRHIFWVVSGVITLAGLAAFVARGEDKYDIEFRGGTQITMKLKDISDADLKAGKKYLTLDEMRDGVTQLSGTSPELKDLAGATIYGQGPENEHRFVIQTTIKNPPGNPTFVKTVLLDPLAKKFERELQVKPQVEIQYADPAHKKEDLDEKHIGALIDHGIIRPITTNNLGPVFNDDTHVLSHAALKLDVSSYMNGTAILLDDISPPQTAAELTARITQERQAESNIPFRKFEIIPQQAVEGDSTLPADQLKTTEADPSDLRPLTRAVMVSVDSATPYDSANEARWQNSVAASEWKLVRTAFATSQVFEGVTTFDAVVASQAKFQALSAVVISLFAIVVYVWIRFGGIWYGIGAILSLVHDAIVALAATVLSGIAYHYFFNDHPNWLLLSDFKINLTMIAAYLTVIGYSVNDTIVIFDRVRELRGRSTTPLTAKLINDAINQCFGRTIWTTFTVFIVVLIMYIWGGEGVRGFSFAMLIGVFTGAYSTLAIASPILLTTVRLHERDGRGPKMGPNPFLRKDAAPELPAAPAILKPDPQG